MVEFRFGFQLRPSEASPLVEVAAIQFLLKRPDDAVASLQQALVVQPDHPMAMATLMIYRITTNDESGARAQWEKVRQQTRTPAPVVEGLKKAFQQQFGRTLL